jgi:hypothetical protein
MLAVRSSAGSAAGHGGVLVGAPPAGGAAIAGASIPPVGTSADHSSLHDGRTRRHPPRRFARRTRERRSSASSIGRLDRRGRQAVRSPLVPGRSGTPDDSVQTRLRREHPDALLCTASISIRRAARRGARPTTYVRCNGSFSVGRSRNATRRSWKGRSGRGGVIRLPSASTSTTAAADLRPGARSECDHRMAARRTRVAPVGDADLVCTRVRFVPLTGRTHQLRVHAAHPGVSARRSSAIVCTVTPAVG